MRIVLALFAGAVAWMAVVATQSSVTQSSPVRGVGHSGALGRGVQPSLPGHHNRLANYYRIHLN